MRLQPLHGLASALTLVISVQVADAQVPSLPGSLAGCYELSLGAWSRPLGVNAAYHKLPSKIELDTIAAAHVGWVLRPDMAFPSANRFGGMPRWAARGDSVEMVWSNGFQATTLRVRRSSPVEFEGQAVVWSDANEFGNDLPRAPVNVRRTPCN